MPIKVKGKKYKTFTGAKNAVKKSKGLSDKKAAAYVATVDRAQNKKGKTKSKTAAAKKKGKKR